MNRKQDLILTEQTIQGKIGMRRNKVLQPIVAIDSKRQNNTLNKADNKKVNTTMNGLEVKQELNYHKSIGARIALSRLIR